MQISDYQGKNILVTGGSGYLANNLIQHLKDTECHITRLSRSGAILSLVDGKCKMTDVIADLNEPQTWLELLSSIDVIFHFAGQPDILAANNDATMDINRNVLPLLTLLECCRKNHWKPMVVLASTVSIYGQAPLLPVNEAFSDHPLTIYDLHKLHCEQYLNYYVEQGFIKGTTLRLANVYGPGVNASCHISNMLNQMIQKALRNEPLTVYGDGLYKRDYIYIDDISSAFLTAGLHADKVNGEKYIIANNKAYTVVDAVKILSSRLESLTGKTPQIIHVDTPKDRICERHFQGDCHKFNHAVSWQPAVSFEEGIDKTIQALL